VADILNRVSSPADLKSLTPGELDQLAAEIRHEMVSTGYSTAPETKLSGMWDIRVTPISFSRVVG
jgi:hypothetical protein